NLKFNKRKTHLQGGVNIIFRKMVAGLLKTFQVKSNAMSSLGVSGNRSLKRAEFVSKANLHDITDPQNPVSLGGSLDLVITLSDLEDPGNKDSIAVTLYAMNGSLLYSGNWNVSKTNEKELAGGNIEIKDIAYFDRDPIRLLPTNNAATVYPNPSAGEFKLKLSGIQGPYYLMIYDVSGKHLKTLYGTSYDPMSFGSDLIPGTYIVSIHQWNQVMHLKIIKQ
ncbi:MAG TPA: T9SS type A sorting domain-containing protein, partial [Flavisolibacter sp.]|nr:T9SS type A sorting domain-containing protein [Flavisolibacter sp.]